MKLVDWSSVKKVDPGYGDIVSMHALQQFFNEVTTQARAAGVPILMHPNTHLSIISSVPQPDGYKIVKQHGRVDIMLGIQSDPEIWEAEGGDVAMVIQMIPEGESFANMQGQLHAQLAAAIQFRKMWWLQERGVNVSSLIVHYCTTDGVRWMLGTAEMSRNGSIVLSQTNRFNLNLVQRGSSGNYGDILLAVQRFTHLIQEFYIYSVRMETWKGISFLPPDSGNQDGPKYLRAQCNNKIVAAPGGACDGSPVGADFKRGDGA